MQHFIVTATSFIAGALLAPGSRVTSDELGTYLDPKTGEEKPVRPGSTLVEVGEDGQPLDTRDYAAIQGLAGSLSVEPIAAVAPFSPNPTRAQGAPSQPPGGVALAEGDLPTAPAAGVESNEAAAARLQQASNQAEATLAMTRGQPRPEAPTRRSGERGGTRKPATAAPKPRGASKPSDGGDGSGTGENGAG